ncbi:MAG: class I SAM-dependent methyltransferase [Nitrospinota bacterium]
MFEMFINKFREWLFNYKTKPGIRGVIGKYLRIYILKFLEPTNRIRYLPVTKYLNDNHFKDASILEIGVGPKGTGITKYLIKKIVGLDLNFSFYTGKRLGFLDMVRGDCSSLPFKSKTFDCIICMDTLEHISHERYFDILSEIIRVCRKTVILGFPSGKIAEKFEERVRSLYEKKIADKNLHPLKRQIIKERSDFLIEHKDKKLPTVEEIIDILKKAATKYNWISDTRILENESVRFWYYSVLARLGSKPGYVIKSLAFNLVPYCILNSGWGGFYRKIVIIENKSENIS